jgi:dihydrofolate synthase/folylpolyglutamate synthase
VNYNEAQDFLNSLQMHKIKLGLEAMQTFLDKVSRPDKSLRFIHVAGTNGKGSVSVNIAVILAQAGYRAGLFTSPHLSSVRERFRINEHYIPEETFARLAGHIREVLGEEKITYFEFTTALALLWFAESQVDLVVFETGLGGRLDATNVVVPLISVITNVSMDHEAYLGTDLRSVAGEKAGIIKDGIPLITGAAADVSLEVIEGRCRKKNAPLYLHGRDFTIADEESGGWSWQGIGGELHGLSLDNLHCSMRGDYQKANSSLALAALLLLRRHGYRVSEDDIRKGLQAVHWPGRLEYLVLPRRDRSEVKRTGHGGEEMKIRYLIDGAHNPAGVMSLQQTLAGGYSYNRLIVVWGAMEDKDLRLTLPAIAEMASVIVLTKPAGERAAHPAMLEAVLADHLKNRCHQIVNVEEALRFAEENAEAQDLIVIAGSLYLIGEIRSYLVGEVVR